MPKDECPLPSDGSFVSLGGLTTVQLMSEQCSNRKSSAFSISPTTFRIMEGFSTHRHMNGSPGSSVDMNHWTKGYNKKTWKMNMTYGREKQTKESNTWQRLKKANDFTLCEI